MCVVSTHTERFAMKRQVSDSSLDIVSSDDSSDDDGAGGSSGAGASKKKSRRLPDHFSKQYFEWQMFYNVGVKVIHFPGGSCFE